LLRGNLTVFQWIIPLLRIVVRIRARCYAWIEKKQREE
jgi:hypothetical protein